MKLGSTMLCAATSVALIVSLSSVWQPASAAPAPALQPAAQVSQRTAVRPNVVPAADASLSNLQFGNAGLGALDPAFAPSTHDYQILVDDNTTATVTPTPNDPSATVSVTDGGVPATVTSGTATLPLVRGRNDIAVTVTSADHSATSTYRITMWRLAAPKPTIVSLTDSTTSVFGGTRMTVELANGGLPNAPCYRNYFVGGQYTYAPTPVFDPATGLTRVDLTLPSLNGRPVGPQDLHISTSCLVPGGWAYVKSDVVDDNAVTYVAGMQVTSIDAPAAVTTGTPMTVYGPYLSEYSDGREWLTNSAGDIKQLDDWDFTGNGQVVIYNDYSYGDAFDATSGPRTVHYGYCPANQWSVDANCTSVFSKTINWVAPVPTDVSFTPSSGPQTGGTTIRLRGRFIVAGTSDLHIKVGGQDVSSYSTVNEADDSSDRSFAMYTQGYDIVDLAVPASAVTGPVQVTVTNDFGTTVARGTFTYSARPIISAVSPTSVANSGGSVVTLIGTNFGTSGQPTVIIGGVKSPSVVRVSSTKILATVPTLTGTTGVVSVTVASPQGGGISAAASLTLAAPTTTPTIAKINPASGRAGDDATITGAGFGPAGTAGVTVDGVAATVTSSSGSSIAFSVPNTNTPGVKDVIVGTVTGSVTKAHAFTVLPDPAINTVTPAIVPSYAVGSHAKITLDGYGFGSKGTVKVGSARAGAYTATAGGTHIVGVVVPTTAAGPQPIVLTPAGSKTPLRATVNVTAPTLTYVGPDPHDPRYDPANLDTGNSGFVFGVPTTGNAPMRLEGTGFGTGGVVKVGSTAVTTTSWTDTAITFVAPAHAVGPLPMSVTPTHSTLGATRAVGVRYVTAAPALPTISTIASNTDYSRGGRNEFDPLSDDGHFTLTGTNLAGTSAAATRVLVHDGSTTFTAVPTQVTQNSLQFDAPRGVTSSGWKDVEVDTSVGTIDVNFGIYYMNAGSALTINPVVGLCQRSDVTATGSVTYHPATATITSSPGAFGNSGTVTIDGVQITATSYSSTSISLNMANLASNLTNPWGPKSIVITPADTSLPAQSVGFLCQVTPTVTTTINGSSSATTVAAGTTYTPGFTTTGFVGTNPFTASAPTGYEWVTAGDFGTSAFSANVHNGLPASAGDYYVQVSLPHATYDHAPYAGFAPSAVHLTITGTPVTITPVSDNGSTFTYKGQLGDGTGSSSTDFHYTSTSTTDPITKVTWQYRDSICTTGNAGAAWTDGLPSAVARSSTACGGDGTTQSSWDVRVKSFEMTSTGTDRSLYYAGTFPSTQITITPRNLTVSSVRADKVWDDTTTATLGDLQVTGAVTGDDVQLANGAGGATFADAAPGVNKAVTLSSDLTLTGAAAGNYRVTNPQPSVVGTISKASAVLALSSSASSLLLSQHPTATITPQVSDSRGGAVPGDANLATVRLVSQTPSICSVSGTTVTPLAAGTCTIAGSQAASVNYNASTAASDPSSLTETLDIQIFAAPQAITVVADDLRIAVGDDLAPTSQVGGLFGSDSVDGVQYDYYQGGTLLTNPPTAVGTYRVVPHGGALSANDPSVYSNPSSFAYVAGTLVITAQPPSITTISPASGPTAGGTVVTITGVRLDTVRSVTIGGVTLRVGSFTVNGAGTSLRFTTPAVRTPGPVTLMLTATGGASSSDVFTYTGSAPGAPTQVVRSGPASVTFLPPASNGGSPITGYQVSTDNGRTWHTVPTTAGAHGTRVADLTGLAGSGSAQVRVRAVNANGTGPASVANKANAPTRVSPVPADRRATVAFLPPTVPGGPIVRYQASLDGGHTWRTVTTRTTTGGRRTFTVTGLRNGITYHVVVRAVTAAGAGAASTSHSVIPNSAPLGNRPPRVGAQIAVPKNPSAYHGKRRTTTAAATSHNGTWAHEISELGTRQLTAGEAATLDRRSLFRFDSAILTKAGKADVKALAGHMRLAKAVTCEGYTDYAGKRGHELSLSLRRAVAVCQALRQYGAHVVTTTHGYGGARPVLVGGTPESRDANRRVVVLVTR